MKLFFPLLIATLITIPNSLLAITRQAPLAFIENKGQVKDQNFSPRTDIDFKLSAKGINIFIGEGSLHYQWNKPVGEKIETYRMDVTLVGANKNAVVSAEQPGSYYEQYYITGCDGQTAHSFGKITYKNVYPGIDWVLYIKNDALEHEFTVHAGADASQIRLQYNGATTLRLNANGSLSAITPMGEILEDKPFCFDENGKEIRSAYHLTGNILAYNIEHHNGTLTIDPTIVWGTYFGGENLFPGDGIRGSAIHEPSAIYVAGNAGSGSNIATVGSHQSIIGGLNDGCLAKFDSAGNCLWATYYGGMMDDYFTGIDTDPSGNIYCSGNSHSNSNIATPGSHRPTSLYGGIFLVKFNSAGIRQWGTYYGDFSSTNATNVQLVSCGNDGYLYLSGSPADAGDIATPGSFQPIYPGFGSGYLARFDTNGVRQWGTYYVAGIQSMTIDINNDVYFMGRTAATSGIATTGAHQPQLAGMMDNIITKFNTQGEQIWATYYGGDSLEQMGGMSWCDAGLYISGSTNSLNNIATPGTYQPSYAGGYDAFLALFDTSGQRIWGTYFGGPAGDNNPSVSSNASGDCYMVGTTQSVENITLPGAWQKKYGGGILDGYMVKFTSLGAAQWSTYYGGCLQDGPRTCANDGLGNVYIGGVTESVNAIATTGSYQATLNNSADAFLARFNENDFFFTVAGESSVCDGETVTYSIPDIPDAQSYTWALPNGWQGASSSNTINATVTQPGGFINVYVQRTCTIDTFTSPAILVHPLPQPVVTQNVLALSTTAFTSYQWYYNNTLITGATNQTYTATQNGDHYVIVTDSNGCTNTSDTITITSVSVPYLENAARNISVYPNPATDIVNISSGNIVTHISFTDITGRQLYAATPLTRIHNMQVSVASGIYYITITTNDLIVTRKVLINK